MGSISRCPTQASHGISESHFIQHYAVDFRSQRRLYRTAKSMVRLLAALVLVVALPSITHATGAQYVHDPAGRLVQVIAPDGTSAQYTYDPAGNLLAITPLSATTAALTGFSNSSA